MKKILILITSLFICHFLSGQTPDLVREMADNYLQIRQKLGTESLLRDYLSTIESKSDTVYGIIYGPMDCPRCEAAIPAFYRKLKKKIPNQDNFFLITLYNDSLLAAHYNKTKNYKSDYFIYDTEGRYKDIFSFNSNGIQGLYILKVCRKTGRLITGGQFTVLNTLFVDQLISVDKSLDFETFNDESQDNEVFSLHKPVAGFINANMEDYPLRINDHFPVSSIYDLPKYEGRHFFYSDVLGNGIMLFEQNEQGNELFFKSLVQVDSLEKRKFIEVPDQIYQNHIKSGMIYEIACSSDFVDSASLGISYSLPHLMTTGENKYGYFNKAVVLKRNIKTLEADSMISFDFNLFEDDFFYTHFVFGAFQDKIIMGCKKMTWPMEFEPGEYMNNIEMNPFDDRFYDTENPFIAIFDQKSGKVVGRFGQTEPCQRKSRTGYYYQHVLSTVRGDKLLYTNGYTGQLYLVSGDDFHSIQEHYSAFEVDTSEFPRIDSSRFHTYEYVKAYNSFFYRCIESIKMNEEKIFCLVRYGMPHVKNINTDEYTFITIDRKSKQKEEFRLPVRSNMEMLGYGLKDDKDNAINPFVFFRNKENKNYIIRVFDVIGKSM